MKKILIVGNADRITVKQYIEHILLENNYEIYLTNFFGEPKYSNFYAKNNIRLVNVVRLPIVGSLFGVGFMMRILTLILKRQRYDIIHIHNMHLSHIIAAHLAGSKWLSTNIIGSYWGSDLFRGGAIRHKIVKYFLGYFRYLCIATDEMREKFMSVYGDVFNHKIKRVLFATSIFDNISEVLEAHTIEDCKTYFEIDSKKIVASVGYNAIKEQQHVEVIAQIAKIPKTVHDKIFWIFQMTYGSASEKNISDVKEQLGQIEGVNYVVLTEFMTDEEIAKLRVATDIFVHAQTTDAFSASVQEFLYAGTTVVNPVWIEYSQLKTLGIELIEYSNFNELPTLLERLVLNQGPRVENNREKLDNISSWRAVKSDWRKLYD